MLSARKSQRSQRRLLLLRHPLRLHGFPLELLAAAERAAHLPDLNARVTVRNTRQKTVSLWDESRVWDPGD